MSEPKNDVAQAIRNVSRPLDRRAALARLGIAAGVAYVAPTVLQFDRSANAKVLPTPCPPPHAKGRGAPWCPRRR